jgi:hypothetical protein
MSAIFAVAGARSQRFAGHGFGDNPSVIADANAAFDELDGYGQPAPTAAASAAPSTTQPPPASSQTITPQYTSSDDGSSSEFSSVMNAVGPLAQQVITAGLNQIGSNQAPPAPLPPPPAKTIFGIPLPVALVGAGLFLLLKE